MSTPSDTRKVAEPHCRGHVDCYRNVWTMAGDDNRVRELERELEGAQARLRILDAKVAANLARERRAQQRLAAAERLCSTAMLAAGASRSMRGPLDYAALNFDYLVAELAGCHEIPDEVRARLLGPLSEVRNQLQKLHGILSGIDGEPPISERPVTTDDLRRVLLASIRMARGVTASNARISIEFEELPRVLGHELRVTEVFFHLVTNALEALARSDGSDPHVVVTTRQDVDGGVFVTITDSGPGIPREELDLIFEPFFTTKNSPTSAGLGLCLCRHLLDEIGGEIRVESRQGRGATVTVRLRRATDDQAGVPPESTVRFVTTTPPVRRLGRG